jgi:Glycosyltransferases, probably involved in cell wall biogenesis
MPTVTVVVPVLNGSRFVESSISYITQQEYRNLEILFIVDSKTVDDTVEKIEKFSNDLPNCRVIIQEDPYGLSGSRNIGLDEAQGEYIWFMDIDDRPYPDFISTLVRLIEEHDADVTISNFVRSSNINSKETCKKGKKTVLSREQAMKALMSDKIPVTAWSKIIKTDFLRQNDIRFYPGFAEDINHTYKVLNACSKAVYFSKPMYLYYQNLWSICASLGNERGREEIRTYSELIDLFKDTDMEEKICRRSAIMMLRSSIHMDYRTFRSYVKNDEFLDIGELYLRSPLSLEFICVRLSPLTYYYGLQFYLKFFYYRELRYYTKI